MVDALAHAHFEEWSAIFIATNDRIQWFSHLHSSFQTTQDGGIEDKQKLAAYHVVSERLEFADLLSKTSQLRLQTLLTNYSILITNNSESGLAVGDGLITEKLHLCRFLHGHPPHCISPA